MSLEPTPDAPAPAGPGLGAAALGGATPQPRRRRVPDSVGPFFQRYGVLIAFALVILFFALERPSEFATLANLRDVLNSASSLAVMAAVLTVPMIMGDFDLSVGYNIFPGEIFLARNHAKVSTVYVIAGLGTTKFDDASHETVNVGAGLRVFLADWSAVQLDVRDHIFSLNLLGQPQTTQNLELTLGLTFFF